MATDEDDLQRFDPVRDPTTEQVVESPQDFARRMRSTILPNWPEELLVEWLHRHAGHIGRYAFLRFERLRFEIQTWPLDKFPPHAEFKAVTGFDDDLESVRSRARGCGGFPGHFPAVYILEHGTWNTPVVMLDSEDQQLIHPDGWPLMTPYHLLEGHSRLSYLLALRAAGLGNPTHRVWVATL